MDLWSSGDDDLHLFKLEKETFWFFAISDLSHPLIHFNRVVLRAEGAWTAQNDYHYYFYFARDNKLTGKKRKFGGSVYLSNQFQF